MDQAIDKSRIIKAIEKHDEAVDKRLAEAASQIQRVWRKHNAARAKYMNADQRWNDAAVHARLKVSLSVPQMSTEPSCTLLDGQNSC